MTVSLDFTRLFETFKSQKLQGNDEVIHGKDEVVHGKDEVLWTK